MWQVDALEKLAPSTDGEEEGGVVLLEPLTEEGAVPLEPLDSVLGIVFVDKNEETALHF